jgi:hypothetical protein
MPAKPIITSKANQLQYQKRFDQPEKWALADDWDAVRGYPSQGHQQLRQDGQAIPGAAAGCSRSIDRLARSSLRLAVGGDLVEGSAVAVEHRSIAGEILPALDADVDVSGRDL